jgi:hypothetical protein
MGIALHPYTWDSRIDCTTTVRFMAEIHNRYKAL